MAEVLSKNTKTIKGLKFTLEGKSIFLQLDPGAWQGYMFYKDKNAWVIFREASREDLLKIYNLNPVHHWIKV